MIRRIVGILLLVVSSIDLYFHITSSDVSGQAHTYLFIIDFLIIFLGFNLFQSSLTGFCLLEKTLKFFNYSSELDEIKKLSEINKKSAEEKKSYLMTLDLLDEAVLEMDLSGNLLKATDAWFRVCPESMKAGDASCCIGESIYSYINGEDAFQVTNAIKQIQENNSSITVAQFRMKNTGEINIQEKWLEGKFAKFASEDENINIRCILRDITEIFFQDRQIEFFTTHDVLTTLPDRTTLSDRLNSSAERAERYNLLFAILFLDIDNFHVINDEFGYKIADAILVTVASTLKSNTNSFDSIIRWGADEFVILLSDLFQAEDVKKKTMELKTTLKKKLKEEFPSINIDFSIGGSVFPLDSPSTEQLIKYARKSLRASKSRGKNSIVFFDEQIPQIPGVMLQKDDLENRLSSAIHEHRINVFYQPIVNIKTNEVECVEALARWRDDQYGWVEPAMFIRMSESLGLIHELSKCVMEIAVEEFLKCSIPGKNIKLGINLSNRQLNAFNYMYDLMDLVERIGIQKSLLKFEISEDTGLLGLGTVRDSINFLHDNGCIISLDDFASGYSSLTNLLEIPIEELKIDGHFLRLVKQNDAVIALKSLVDLGKNLNLHVVVEGVENATLAEIVYGAGPDMMQGNYVLKAVEVCADAYNFVPDIISPLNYSL